MTELLLRDAELDGCVHTDMRRADMRLADVRARADVRLADGRIVEIGPALPHRRAAQVLECRGGALLPGLCDHHLHLHALAARARSVSCGPPAVCDAAGLAAALAAAPADERGWIRGVGYVESVAGDLDATTLDRLHGTRPVRVQHRSGALWMVNSAAAERLDLAAGAHPGIERDGREAPTGRLWRADDWLRARLPVTGPPDLAPVGKLLARMGVTAVTDATPDLDTAALEAITAAVGTGALPQRVHLLGAPLGWSAPDGTGVTTGPYKIVLADSALPDLDALTEQIRAVHAAGRAVAAHCVTREALVLLLAAVTEAGARPGDRIEHASLVPAELVGELARHRLAVVTQPGFLADRGEDYLRDVPGTEHADLYRCRSLLAAGVPLALSSDAPYGPVDPWAVITAAVARRSRLGRVVGPAERLTPAQALAAYLADPDDPGGRPRAVRPGAPADVVLLEVPLAQALASPDAGLVRTVIVGGRVV